MSPVKTTSEQIPEPAVQASVTDDKIEDQPMLPEDVASKEDQPSIGESDGGGHLPGEMAAISDTQQE